MDFKELIGDGAASSSHMTYFNLHFNHTITDDDASDLDNKSRKFNHTLPPFPKSKFAWIGTNETSSDQLQLIHTASGCIKPQLLSHWMKVIGDIEIEDFDSSERGYFLSLCSRYYDILHYNKKPFYRSDRFDGDDASALDAYVMHSLNHVFKSRDLVVKNDKKLDKLRESGGEGDVLTDLSFCDCGFTRPKVLILLPFKSFAFRVVKRLVQLVQVEVKNFERFYEEYGASDNEDAEEKKKRLGKRYKRSYSVGFESKPMDFRALFGGNNEQHFALGIKVTRKSVELYSDFYSSDIIIASPLGLLTRIEEAKMAKEKDVDYLSSIEVLIVDHSDVMTMQNWVHVKNVIGELNKMPSSIHATDVMRIRQWHLKGLSRYYRQTIVLGSYLTPDINKLFHRQCVNFQGKVKLAFKYPGVISRVPFQVAHIFQRFNVDSLSSVDAVRQKFFEEKIFPTIRESEHSGVMIFTRSHLERVTVSRFLRKEGASYCVIDDETIQTSGNVSRVRQDFLDGKYKIILYTERAHFYRRYHIRGVKNLIMYSPPERNEFYLELMNMLQGSHKRTSLVLFSKVDNFQLERIVGSVDAKRMLTSKTDIFAYS